MTWPQEMLRKMDYTFRVLCVWVIQGGNVIVQLSGVGRRICSGKACIMPRDIKMSGRKLCRVGPLDPVSAIHGK